MNKTWIILKREYLTRVTKKSFLITTLLVPLAMIALILVPGWLASRDVKQERVIAVFDESTLFFNQLGKEGYTQYSFIDREKYEALKNNPADSGYYALLYIPANILTTNSSQLLSGKQMPIEFAEEVQRKLSQIVEAGKRATVVRETGIADLEDKLAATRTKVKVETLTVSGTGEQKKSSSMVAFIASYGMGFIIYFFVFMYGSMVMRSVMEEKKNRIVEVIVSSVKPFQLMIGKIIGTALVGLTQVGIWIILGVATMGILRGFLSPEATQQVGQSILESQQQINAAGAGLPAGQDKMSEILEMISTLNLPLLIGGFIFYFLGGYLLYSSLMGAIGAAVDNDEDTQQFILPVTLPLIISIVLLIAIIKNPEGALSFWASIIPFTSPICMLARLPFSPPGWEIILSMLLLVLTTVGAIWAGAKIYRTGILMYGKKVTYRELVKWMTYKD